MRIFALIAGGLLAAFAGFGYLSDRHGDSGPAPWAAFTDETTRPASPTVVELFTSQGCSSCPPADELLIELAASPDIVAIAYHVNYWDYIGWKDPFATDWGTARQRRYRDGIGARTIYTPQMVVDGAVDVVGSRRGRVAGVVTDSRRDAGRRVPVDLARDDASGDILVALPERRLGRDLDIWLVRYSGARLTEVLRGENRGETLRNANIAREMRHLGEWTGEAKQLRIPASGDDEPRGGIAVLLQEPGPGAIHGAAKLDFR